MSRVSNAGVAIALSDEPSGSAATAASRLSRAVCSTPRAARTRSATSSLIALLLRDPCSGRHRFQDLAQERESVATTLDRWSVRKPIEQVHGHPTGPIRG